MYTRGENTKVAENYLKGKMEKKKGIKKERK